MPTKQWLLIACLMAMLTTPIIASEEHGGGMHYAFQLEVGAGSKDNGDGFSDWDVHGWLGTDEHKLWLKSEGERENGITEQAEFWAMYSRNIATFWDLQLGVRHDTKPISLSYGAIGFEGLAPYFFETEAHVLVSEDGDISARIEQEKEWLITQKLISESYIELNIFAQDVPELDVGAGLSYAELGIQTHYQLSRTFAPYVDMKYERKFGETSSIAKSNGEDSDAFIVTLGVKFLF